MKILKILICMGLLGLLGGCGGSSGNTSDSNSAYQASDESGVDTPPKETDYSFLKGRVVDRQEITSAITGIRYPVDIYLPPGYEDGNQKYPIIYTTDGQAMFPGLPFLLEDEGFEAILVAISEGPENRRAIDYLLPGAEQYFAFLTTEVIPLVESQYRVEEKHRSLVGTSFGGVFSIVAMLIDDVVDPYFHNIMAFDASLYRNQKRIEDLIENRYMASRQFNVNLVLTGAVPLGNVEYIDDFLADITDYGFTGLEVSYKTFSTTHAKIAEPSFRESLHVIQIGR